MSAQTNEAPVIFREPQLEDLSFIFSSWLKSYRDGSEFNSLIPSKLYFDGQKKVIAEILKRAEIVIAANPEDLGQIFGYIVFETTPNITLIHYVYVKHSYRMMGISQRLYGEFFAAKTHVGIPAVVTHMTKAFNKHLAPSWDVVFNPYVIKEKDFYG